MDDKHLTAVMNWIAMAQDSLDQDRGISAAYSLIDGWKPSYPETTGYIINTFLDYARFTGNQIWQTRAIEAGNWLISVQFPDGSFPGGYAHPKAKPKVFNTGMILFGLSELAEVTGSQEFYETGHRALEWLINSLDQDGTWTTVSEEKKPHAYHSRVGWGILRMGSVMYKKKLPEYISRAVHNIGNWVILQQDNKGWFRHNDLIPGMPPLTHNIAYTLRGLLEMGAYLKQNEFISAAQSGADCLLSDWKENGYLAAGYGPGWKRGLSFRCVTGDAQMGLVWFRLYELTGSKRYIIAAFEIAKQIAKTQFLLSPKLKGIFGAIPGSWPIYGRYLRFSYPNWAAKFFADLSLALLKVQS